MPNKSCGRIYTGKLDIILFWKAALNTKNYRSRGTKHRPRLYRKQYSIIAITEFENVINNGRPIHIMRMKALR